MEYSRKNIFQTVIAVVITIIFLFPVYWMVKTSLTPITDLFLTPPEFGLMNSTIAAYVDNFINNQDMLHYIGNSFIVAIGTMVMSLLFAVPGAYALARLDIRGKSILLILLLAIQMLPGITMAMPLFIMFSKLQLVDSYLGLILADMIHALPFAVLILRPSFLALPKGLEEAAAIDGCNKFTAFTRIILPLVVPGMMTVAVFCFLFGWGDFIFALTLTTENSVRPLTLGLYRFIGQYGTEWNNLMAVATIAAMPIIIIFVALQRYVVGGIVAGSMKD